MSWKKGHRKLLHDLENDQSSVGMGLFAARDLRRWFDNLQYRGKLTREEHQSLLRLLQEVEEGLSVSRKWLEWVRWGRV